MRLNAVEYNYCNDLLQFKSLDSCRKYLDLLLELLFDIIGQHHKDPVSDQMEADARIYVQLYFSRLLNFRTLLDGVSFKGKNGALNPIIDPSVLFTETRGLFESLSVFELVWVVPNSFEKRWLMHKLFTIAGMHERQEFSIYNDTLKQVLLQERVNMERLIGGVKQSGIYLSLDKQNREKIDNNIRSGKFRIYLNDLSHITKADWDDSRQYFGMDISLFDDMYRFFSLHAHPSSIAIWQFEDAFQKENPEFVNLAKTAVRFAVAISSIFIADYIKSYPDTRSTYNVLLPYQKMLVDRYNSLCRGKKYAIFEDKD